ncbi:MAG: DUF5719 family protein [Acidimicrobiia bacterium]|nr:DUF5719 family protein [Acidimicrobiia bacterium]
MRRLILAVVVAAAATVAAVLPQPEPAAEPLAGRIIDRPGLESPDAAAIWYCPWAQATATRDSFIAVASLEESTAAFTFPVTIPGEPADTAELQTLAPGGAALDLSTIAQRGDSPSFAEFTNGPSSVAVTVRGEVLAADTCVASGPDTWVFPGGSTLAGEELTLRLFNPFPETARVTVTAVSDIGAEALGELRLVSVGSRSWRDVSFEELLRQRADLAVSVTVEDGLVVPAMVFRAGDDEDWWSGTALSTVWEFPAAGLADAETAIVVANPGPSEVQVSLLSYTEAGPEIEPTTFTVPPESPLRIPVEGAAEHRAVRLSSDAPVAAAVVSVGEPGTAITSGLSTQARTWMVPGLRGAGLESGTLWILNSSEEPTTVTVSALSGAGLVGERITIDPGSQRRVDVDDPDAVGYLVQAADPITVSWSITGPGGRALSVGAPVSTETTP